MRYRVDAVFKRRAPMVPFKIFAILVVAIAMSMALAHLLELPGKLRLAKEQYLAVQAIYYPGFTYGGAAEPIGIIVTAVLALAARESSSFWLLTASCAAMVAMQAIYWIWIQPVNNVWLKDTKLEGASGAFMGIGKLRSPGAGTTDWTDLRNRWEFAHAARAGLAVAAFVLLVAAVVGPAA
jgi:Domain of unknown function (DUF1772)